MSSFLLVMLSTAGAEVALGDRLSITEQLAKYDLTPEHIQHQLQLFTGDVLQAGKLPAQLQLDGGEKVSLPIMDPSRNLGVQGLLITLAEMESAEQGKYLASLAILAGALANGQVDELGLPPEVLEELDELPTMESADNTGIDQQMLAAMESAFTQYMLVDGENDADAVINNVMLGALASLEAQVCSLAQQLVAINAAEDWKDKADVLGMTYRASGTKDEVATFLVELERMWSGRVSQVQTQLLVAEKKLQSAKQNSAYIMENQYDKLKAIVQKIIDGPDPDLSNPTHPPTGG